MSATADPLYSFFCLLGVLVLLPDFSKRRIAIACALMFVGLLGKESAIIFPLLAASCLYLQSKRRFEITAYFRLWPLALTSMLYICLRSMLMPSMPSRLAVNSQLFPSSTQYPVAAFPTYLRLLLWPAHLHMGHDMPVFTNSWHVPVLAGVCILAVMMFCIRYKARDASLPMGWGFFWFLAAYAPCLSVDALFYEHWLYLPSVGLFLGIAQSLSLLVASLSPGVKIVTSGFAVVTSCVTALVMGAITYTQNGVWSEPISFYKRTIDEGEKAVQQHINLGVLYAERGDGEMAIEEFRLAIQNSRDTDATAEDNLASALLMLPDRSEHIAEAEWHFKRAVEIAPDSFSSLNTLAEFYAGQGDAAQAAFYRQKADSIIKKHP